MLSPHHMFSLLAQCVGFVTLLSVLLSDAAQAQGSSETPDLVGDYHFDIMSRTLVKLPVLGDTEVVTKQTNLLRIRKTDSGLKGEHTACSLDAQSTRSIVHTEIPQIFVDALPVQHWTPTFNLKDGKWQMRVEMPQLAIGYVPTASERAVPLKAKDPRVIDWDEDGHLAATVNLHVPLMGIIQIYTAQRAQTILEGTIQDNGDITGDAWLILLEQRTLGASNSLFAANPNIRPHPDPSPFIMKPVPPESTCKTLPGAQLTD